MIPPMQRSLMNEKTNPKNKDDKNVPLFTTVAKYFLSRFGVLNSLLSSLKASRTYQYPNKNIITAKIILAVMPKKVSEKAVKVKTNATVSIAYINNTPKVKPTKMGVMFFFRFFTNKVEEIKLVIRITHGDNPETKPETNATHFVIFSSDEITLSQLGQFPARFTKAVYIFSTFAFVKFLPLRATLQFPLVNIAA